MQGLCKYESLKDGALDLCDIALMNDAILVRDTNTRCIQEAMKRQ